MPIQFTDQQIVDELNLSYQQIATALGVTRQAVRNAIVKNNGYLTLDRLLKIYEELPQGRHNTKLQSMINDALPWNSIEAGAKLTDTSKVLSRKWNSAWIFAPGLHVIQPTLKALSKYAREAVGLSVAVILPKISDADELWIKQIFKGTIDKESASNFRLAISEMAHTSMFPAIIIFNLPQLNGYDIEAYLVCGTDLIPIPGDQMVSMVSNTLFNINPWQDNTIWDLKRIFSSLHKEIQLSQLPGAASAEDGEEGFSLEYRENSDKYGSIQITLTNTKTGWWITIDSDDLDEQVNKITLFGAYQNKTINILETCLSELPVRKPWPLSGILPSEALKNNESGIKLEVI